jgi:hypothetical protein
MHERLVMRPSPGIVSSRYLRVAGTIVAGGVIVGLLAGILLILLPIALGGGNGMQLARIASLGVFIVSSLVGLGAGVGAAIVGCAFGASAAALSRVVAVELVALAVGAAIGSIPIALFIAGIMGWDALAASSLIASLSGIGAIVAWAIVMKRLRRARTSSA